MTQGSGSQDSASLHAGIGSPTLVHEDPTFRGQRYSGCAPACSNIECYVLRKQLPYRAGSGAGQLLADQLLLPSGTDRRLSGVERLPLTAAKPWFSARMVCQPIEGHHGATGRCRTAASGRRTSSLNLFYWRKPIRFVPRQYPAVTTPCVAQPLA